MKNVLLFVLLALSSHLSAQDYKIKAFQDVYTPLKNYKSIFIEQKGDPYWESKISLDFTFPFFDLSYDYIICLGEGMADFEDAVDFPMFLMAFGYMYDQTFDSTNIESDVRYALTQRDGLKALAVQFTKNRLFSDTTIEQYDSYINFQWWFFEDGAIEIRFGDINLDHSNVYVPGEGFYLFTTDGPKLSGPFIGLRHPHDTSREIGIDGPYDNYKVFNSIQAITTLPPKGWVIRFENQLVANKDIKDNNGIRLYPNPVRDRLYVKGISKKVGYSIHNWMGQRMISASGDSSIDVSALPAGVYFLEIRLKNAIIVKKFMHY